MPTLLQEVDGEVAAAITAAFPTVTEPAALVTPAKDAKFGDYQSNAAMGLAKTLGKKPREVAEAIAAALAASPSAAAKLAPPEIAGPGFINVRLRPEWVTARLTAMAADVRLGVPLAQPPRTYVIDFSSPNVAKPMHVGHIRSTIIGDSLTHLLRFLGHAVITDNHIGDWGTQFGMLIVGYRRYLNAAALEADPIEELVRLYRIMSGFAKVIEAKATLTKPNLPPEVAAEQRAILDRHAQGPFGDVHVESTLDEARAELVKLQQGDPENLALWRQFVALSLREFDKIYARLGIAFDHVLGESFYNPMLAGVVAELKLRGIARESEGALCVFPEGPGLPATPFIVQKRDGAFNYATTDLATIKHRVEHFHADASLYVVGTPQADHFKQLFATARMWGYDKIELRHVEFGSVLGGDRKLLRTRSGETFKLADLLDEAEQRSRALMLELQPEMPEAERNEIADVLAVGAVKYADLMQNRTSDYVYSADKMVALKGNTAPYLMYSYVRCRSIFRKADTTPEAVAGAAIQLGHPTELTLAKQLLRLPDALASAVAEYRPDLIAAYLYETAECLSAFHRDCPVIHSEEPLRSSRLRLCDVVARTLQLGMTLLGIRTVERM